MTRCIHGVNDLLQLRVDLMVYVQSTVNKTTSCSWIIICCVVYFHLNFIVSTYLTDAIDLQHLFKNMLLKPNSIYVLTFIN